MSFESLERVIKLSKTKQSQRLLMMALAHRADKYGVCWPGIETLAKDINAAPRNTGALVAKLKLTGELVIIPGGGRTHSNHYIITLGLSKSEVAHIIATHHHIKINPDDSDIKGDDSDRVLGEINPDDSGINPDDSGINPDDSGINPDDIIRGTTNNLHRTKKELTTSRSSSSNFDIDFSDCLNLYRNNIGNLSQLQIEDFGAVFDGLSPPPTETRYEWFQYAILEAAGNGVNNWKYVKAILQNLDRAGSLAKHKEARNGQVSGTTTGHRGPNEKKAGNGHKAGGGSNSGDSRVGTGQTPEMRAKLKAGFARH